MRIHKLAIAEKHLAIAHQAVKAAQAALALAGHRDMDRAAQQAEAVLRELEGLGLDVREHRAMTELAAAALRMGVRR